MEIERHGKIIYTNRMVGGISWPSTKKGCACIVGEDSEYDYDLDAYPIYLIEEMHSMDNGELIQWASERRHEYGLDSFVSQRSTANIKFLSLWNRNERPMGSPRFHVKQAPMSQDNSLEYHLKVIKSRTRKERKTLFLTPNSLIKMQLLDIQNTMETTPQEYPAVAAFCYAVATLNLYQRDTAGEVAYRRAWSKGQIV